MAEWQDGVHDGLKIAFRDAYRELPQAIKDVITEPRERIKGLYRGFEISKSEVLKNLKDEYEETYERLVARLEKVQEREGSTEEQIKEAEDAITETEKEERQRYKDFEEASTINGWTPSYTTAKKFGQYVLTSDDVENFDAIVSTRKVENIMKSVFKQDSISKDYQGGLHRLWASTEEEYIVMGVRISREAQDLKESWTDKNIGMQIERTKRERERDGY
jgi:predicted HicB family RNase H-like nuclease